MIKDYYSIVKPGIIYGNALTLVAGFMLASQGSVKVGLLLLTLIGLSCVIGSGCVFNNYIDRDIDALMERTKGRVMVKGSLSPSYALVYGTVLGVVGFCILVLFTNRVTVIVSMIGFFVYVGIYSMWLKRSSTHSSIIGSISGAVPPVIGYLAVTGSFDRGALLLFFILALWQMPHSLAIAIYRLRDYQAASIPVLPVRKGIYRTKVQILVYTILFVIFTGLLYVYGYAGKLYLFIMIVLGTLWVLFALKGFFISADEDKLWARSVFLFSLIILTVFSGLLILGIGR